MLMHGGIQLELELKYSMLYTHTRSHMLRTGSMCDAIGRLGDRGSSGGSYFLRCFVYLWVSSRR